MPKLTVRGHLTPPSKRPRRKRKARPPGSYKPRPRSKQAAAPAPVPQKLAKPAGCQHPRSRARGCCQQPSVGLVDIPAGYIPATRHANQPELPRPQARLCVQHRYLVEAFAAGDAQPKDFAHRSQCPVCACPNHERVVKSWLKWMLSNNEAAAELGVSVNSWHRHVHYYGYDDKKNDKVNTLVALQRIADEGMASGRPTIKHALEAIREIAKQRGDPQNIDMRVGVMDLSQVSDAELAKMLREAAAEAEAKSRLPVTAEVVREK